MKLLKNTLIASALALSVSAPASAVVLNIQNNILMGATGVDVGGTLYDVSFIDGILGENITAFTTQQTAYRASQALLSQVFTGNFDSLQSFTNGCGSTTGCATYTPYGFTSASGVYVGTAYVFNSNINTSDSYTYGSFPSTRTTVSNPLSNIARWSLSTPAVSAVTTAVPEPETYAMFLAGLGLMGFASRRKLAS
jgi:hypothetical protein